MKLHSNYTVCLWPGAKMSIQRPIIEYNYYSTMHLQPAVPSQTPALNHHLMVTIPARCAAAFTMNSQNQSYEHFCSDGRFLPAVGFGEELTILATHTQPEAPTVSADFFCASFFFTGSLYMLIEYSQILQASSNRQINSGQRNSYRIGPRDHLSRSFGFASLPCHIT